jgi:hypothetical protein
VLAGENKKRRHTMSKSATIPTSSTSARTPGVIEQFRVASNNPTALLAGCLLGGVVPFFTFWAAHYELDNTKTLWTQPVMLLVLGGLIYSAKTVWQWGKLAFACPAKATGFVILVEGTMVTLHNPWITSMALGYLIVINAIATGCTLATGDKGQGTRRPAKAKSRKTTVRKTVNKKVGA